MTNTEYITDLLRIRKNLTDLYNDSSIELTEEQKQNIAVALLKLGLVYYQMSHDAWLSGKKPEANDCS